MNPALRDLPVLVVDCQTTGSNPRNGRLLEIGWMEVRPSDETFFPAEPQTRLLRLPPEETIPPAVRKLTGIGEGDLETAVDPADAWELFVSAARGIAALGGFRQCPTVIHFARFEIPFLSAWHKSHANGDTFPLDIICTHDLAVRLLPDLPRKGLRAVAGFLGHSVPPEKRCGPHMQATAVIWRHLVGRLARDARVVTWGQLHRWSANALRPARGCRVYPMPAHARRHLPDAPGVYRMVRSNGDLLYVGKARCLKTRVNSYFQARRHSEKILEMLSQARGVDVHRTETALEAALLESQMIKEDRPPYNTALTVNDRTLVFLSPDFGAQAVRPDATFRLGPVPAGKLFAGLHELGAWLSKRNDPWDGIDGTRLLALPAGSGPDGECLRQGVAMFRARHTELFERYTVRQALRHIGRRCWMEKRLRREGPDAQDDSEVLSAEESVGDAPEIFAWTPAAVVDALEARLRHGGFLLRRANWLTMLSESGVAWQSLRPGKNHVLVFHRGRITGHTGRDGDMPPLPPGWEVSPAGRKHNLDLQAYDRLRVMTTELRRLLAEKRAVAVRLRPGVILREQQLKTLLQWV